MAHREWIGGRIYTLLSHYWREDDDDMLTAAIAADWAEVLEGIPQQYIQSACIKYQRDEERRKPTPGAIYRMARDMMPRPQVVRPAPPAEPERVRVTADEASEIMAAAGFRPKRMVADGEGE